MDAAVLNLGHRLGFLVQRAGTCSDCFPGNCCLEELLVDLVPGTVSAGGQEGLQEFQPQGLEISEQS